MIRPEDEERALKAPDQGGLPAPFVAMAEALRANAEALNRLDRSQQRIVESIEKSERAQQVVASTRALNETFRGLSEIQRGLLDSLANRGKGGGGASPLLLVLAALLSGLLCVLVYDRWISERTVPIERLAEARADGDALRARIEEMKTAASASDARERDLAKRIASQEDALTAAGKGATESADKIDALKAELKEKDARVEQFLAVKAQADLAGALQIQNAGLEREARDLKEKVEALERERANALEVFGEKLLDLRGADPQAIKAIAERMGIYQEPAARPPPGVVTLSRSGERLLVNEVNRLLPDDGEESYDLVHVGSVADGRKLSDVSLTRTKNRMIVNSLMAKEMTIRVDPEADTVELRLKDGEITNPVRPGDRIPIPAEGHSIFLRGAGVKEWLRREGDRVALDAGEVTWPLESAVGAPRAPLTSPAGR
jgi:HAMP domain-containing protein